MFEKIKNAFLSSYGNDSMRRILMFRLLNFVLFIVSLIMSVMNIITKEYVLFYITAAYSLLCVINFLLCERFREFTTICFFIETIAMLSAFIITGIPSGFSILWTLLIPACALAIFGKKIGSLLSGVLFAVIIFFFWLPFGRELLMYNYSKTYMLRFPVVYICIYLISFYIEWIRRRTFEKLIETEKNYRWLYRHDALTEAYNRHAFYEELDNLLSKSNDRETATIMIDINDFKTINDKYGHNAGDKVLCLLSNIILTSICDHSIYCRWGGDEFLIAMNCEHDPNETIKNIREKISGTVLKLENGESFTFSASFGFSLGTIENRNEFSEQVNRADKAMYNSKIDCKKT